MVKQTVTIRHKYGIHARPAAKIALLCNSFEAAIEIAKQGEPVANGKNILDIMMLAAGCGENLEIRANGADEAKALQELATVMESDFETNEI